MRLRPLASAFAALVWCTPAYAHLMPQQQGTLNVRDSAVFCVFSIPVSALSGWDLDGDGRMSLTEFTAARAVVTKQIDAGISLHAGRSDGVRAFLQASLDLEESTSPAGGATHLIVLLRQSFATVPKDVRLTMTLFGGAPDEQAFLIKATRGGSPEVGVLDASRPARIFFSQLSLPAGTGRWMHHLGSTLSEPRLLGVIGVAAILLVLITRRRSASAGYAIEGPATR
jgi:hypothetical protein